MWKGANALSASQLCMAQGAKAPMALHDRPMRDQRKEEGWTTVVSENSHRFAGAQAPDSEPGPHGCSRSWHTPVRAQGMRAITACTRPSSCGRWHGKGALYSYS